MWLKTDNDIREDGAHLLYDSLQCNTTLTELDVNGELMIKINKKINRINKIHINRFFDKSIWSYIDWTESEWWIKQ